VRSELGERAGAVLERVARGLPTGATADLRLEREHWGTMRLANSAILQPHFEETTHLSLRVAVDHRLGTATSSDLSSEGIDRAAAEALSLARAAPRDRTFPGFPREAGRPKRTPFSPSTARLSPEAQARIAGQLLHGAGAERKERRVSGVLNIGLSELAVANTSGLVRDSRRSTAQASVQVDEPEADPPRSGWAEAASWEARGLDPEALGRQAAERLATTAPISLAPGKFRVLLDIPAASEVFGWLAQLGFGGHAEVEGWSCLRKKRGRRVAPSAVTMIDDPTAPASMPQSIDFEGVATRATPLLSEGVVGPPVVDLSTGGKLRRKPTGHALPPEAPWGDFGPMPTHALVAPGDARFDELVRETRRGLLVTRFHYIRAVDPSRSLLTGMTRSGTYWIERGEIQAPVRNLRFTESMLAAVAGVELLGRERGRVSDERGLFAVTTPPILTKAFRFTSATLF
jgi:PmbA protein